MVFLLEREAHHAVLELATSITSNTDRVDNTADWLKDKLSEKYDVLESFETF